MKKLNQGESHIVIGVIGLVVVAVIIFAGIKVLGKKETTKSSGNNSTQQTDPTPKQEEAKTEFIRWGFDDVKWSPSSTPPACKDPFVFDQSPVDVSKVTSILYPGQTRGNNYKAHGGFGYDNATNTSVDVKMPFDAYLISGSRYIESDEQQILLDFQSNCGIAIRFDHLKTLSPSVQAIVDKNFPQPKVDDTRGTNLSEPVLFKAGDLVATEVGHAKPKLNVGMDFGVYDYRSPNQSSKSAAYQAAHGQYSSQTYYGVCWFDLLPAADAAKVKALPSRDQKMGKTSDYCR